jgi:hypothetical protein
MSVRLTDSTKKNINRVVETPEGVSEFFVWVQSVFTHVQDRLYDLAYADDDETDPTCKECGQARPETPSERAARQDKRAARDQLYYYSSEMGRIVDTLAEFDPDWVKEAK